MTKKIFVLSKNNSEHILSIEYTLNDIIRTKETNTHDFFSLYTIYNNTWRRIKVDFVRTSTLCVEPEPSVRSLTRSVSDEPSVRTSTRSVEVEPEPSVRTSTQNVEVEPFSEKFSSAKSKHYKSPLTQHLEYISRTPNPPLEYVENYYNEIEPRSFICVSIPRGVMNVLVTIEDTQAYSNISSYTWSLCDKSDILEHTKRYTNSIVGKFYDLRPIGPDPPPTYNKINYNYAQLDLNLLSEMDLTAFYSILDDNLNNYVPHVSKLIGDYLV